MLKYQLFKELQKYIFVRDKNNKKLRNMEEIIENFFPYILDFNIVTINEMISKDVNYKRLEKGEADVQFASHKNGIVLIIGTNTLKYKVQYFNESQTVVIIVAKIKDDFKDSNKTLRYRISRKDKYATVMGIYNPNKTSIDFIMGLNEGVIDDEIFIRYFIQDLYLNGEYIDPKDFKGRLGTADVVKIKNPNFLFDLLLDNYKDDSNLQW